MKKYHIPTAEYRVFDNMDEALDYLKTAPIPTVVKAMAWPWAKASPWP